MRIFKNYEENEVLKPNHPIMKGGSLQNCRIVDDLFTVGKRIQSRDRSFGRRGAGGRGRGRGGGGRGGGGRGGGVQSRGLKSGEENPTVWIVKHPKSEKLLAIL